MAQPQTHAIANARYAQQAVDNAKAGDIHLTPEDLQAINAIGRQVTDYLPKETQMWDW